jgi:pimeloyl-ACP methyl ester carboxylesterase
MTVRRVTVAPDIELDVHEAGRPGDPVVVLLHGFPESAHSWRHQMEPLAAAGYHVLAPDQRGYGASSAPRDVDAYLGDLLADDVCALLDDVGVEQAFIVGHDWGALLAWHLGMTRPERCRSVIAASVPFNEWPARPTDVFQFLHEDRFFYILYFQEVGVAEAEFDADPERFLRAIIWGASGEGARTALTSQLPMAGTTMTMAMEHALGGAPEGLPPWITDAEFDHFVEQFRTSGFFGPVSWYRNLDANYERTKDLGAAALTMPTGFIAGDLDPVISQRMELVSGMESALSDFHGSILIPGVGHWVQQEAPEAFTSALLDLLGRTSG